MKVLVAMGGGKEALPEPLPDLDIDGRSREFLAQQHAMACSDRNPEGFLKRCLSGRNEAEETARGR